VCRTEILVHIAARSVAGRYVDLWICERSRLAFVRDFNADIRRQHDGDDRLVRVDVGDGRDADARRLDDVDGVDADAWTDLGKHWRVPPRHVGRDDGRDNDAVLGANAVALPPAVARTGETRLGLLTALVGVG
jgi:hypothetical protein